MAFTEPWYYKKLFFNTSICDLCALIKEVSLKPKTDFCHLHLNSVSMTGLSCKDLVNKENDEAKTCLHLAVQGGHVEVS